MPRFTPQEMADKWQRRLSGSISDMERGIRGVTVAPTKLAAQKKTKMLQRLTEAVNSGKWEAGLNGVSLEQWQTATITKGLPRVAQGAQAGQAKFEAFAAKLIPFQDTLRAKVGTMPDLTLEDSIARMGAWIRGMAGFKK